MISSIINKIILKTEVDINAPPPLLPSPRHLILDVDSAGAGIEPRTSRLPVYKYYPYRYPPINTDLRWMGEGIGRSQTNVQWC